MRHRPSSEQERHLSGGYGSVSPAENRVPPDDPGLTSNGGLVLVAETCRVLDVVGTIDRHVGPIKARSRGVGAGELLVGLAECMLAGGDFFCDLDTMRADVAGAQLRAVADPPASRSPPSTTPRPAGRPGASCAGSKVRRRRARWS